MTPPSVPDFDQFRLRRFLETLAREGEVETHEASVKLSEVGRILDGNPKAVLFNQAGAGRSPLVGNVLGSRKRVAQCDAWLRSHALPPMGFPVVLPLYSVMYSREMDHAARDQT